MGGIGRPNLHPNPNQVAFVEANPNPNPNPTPNQVAFVEANPNPNPNPNQVAFVEAVSAPPARVTRFVVHARTAILGLSTADNRAVPPLRHETVFRLAERFPHLEFELNGQVGTLPYPYP